MMLFKDISHGAAFDPTRRYRYRLWRAWGSDRRRVLWVMLNPSTADESTNDRTIAKCVKFTRAFGWDGLEVCNLFAWRATDPKTLKPLGINAIGPDNDAAILTAARAAVLVIAAWGTHGALLDRGSIITRSIQSAGVQIYCLAVTKDGHPQHPLYLPDSTLPIPWPSVQPENQATEHLR